MLQKIRNHFITKWIAIGFIPSFLLPIASFASISKMDATNRKSYPMSSVRTLEKKDNVYHIDTSEKNTFKNELSDVETIDVVSGVGGPSDGNYGGAVASGEFVDLSTGDFSYSIPLLDVGGYPITLSYDANVTMDQQASMVGLGWSLSTGAINRVVRGIPDDFNGDPITTTMNLRPQLSITNNFALNAEFIGLDLIGDADLEVGAGIDVGYTFSNYTGNESSIGGSGTFGIGKKLTGAGPSAFLNAGLNSSSRSGLSTNVGASIALGENGQFSSSLGLNRNSLHGSSLSTSFGYGAGNSFGNMGLSLNGTFSLGMQSYTPTASFEFNNKSWTLETAVGYELPLTALHGGYSRTKSTVCLKERVKTQPAFGYMNQQNGYASNAIQDFNINLGEVHENVSSLNTPMPTNDYFIVSGAGMFRAIRNDAGYVKNPTTKSDGDAVAIGADFAIGVIPYFPFTTFEAGLNVNYNWNNTTSGNWVDNNPLSGGTSPDFAFSNNLPLGSAEDQGKYEEVVFQKVNSRGSSSDDRYDGMRGENPLRQEIAREAGEIVGKSSMTSDNGDPLYYPSANSYYQVERRNQNEVLINESNRELRLADKDKMRSYTINSFNYVNGDYTGATDITRTDELKYPGHHIGQLTLISTGGFKQVYGVPVMNESDQVSFNISEINNYTDLDAPISPVVGENGLVSFKPTQDNSLDNLRGDNNFFMKNHVPSHATSYLLTQQLSDNYVDLTDNGPTPDDYGSYTRINYGFEGQSQWRFPFELGQATYNEGFKSNTLDDMGSYAYGRRDDWLIHSIETKNYIAEFSYSVRDDARSVSGENGGVGDPTQRLDEIRLYSRQGKERGENPLKTVHLGYSYDLCNGTPDNDTGGGKLTLKTVYFTGQDSPEGQLHKYLFDYAHNAPYNPSQVDRWGNYQTGESINYDALWNGLDNGEYPYTNQNVSTANEAARIWKLSSIDLPTGSRIEIKYEADQYELIQNQEATRMFKIDGFYASEESELASLVYGDFTDAIFDPDNKDQEYFYMVVNLDGAIAGSYDDALSVFENHYLPISQGTSRYLYFNTLLNLAPHNDGIVDPDIHEYIQGYAELVNEGWRLLGTPGDWNRVVYQVKPAHLNQGKPTKGVTHPVSRKAWQVIKEAMPLVLYPEDDLSTIYAKDGLINCDGVDLEDSESGPDLSDDSKNHKKNMKSIRSIYHMMRNTGFASRAVINPDEDITTLDSKCWVRMRPGPVAKVGGGHRVSEIRMFDNWNENVPTENSSEYGLVYDYTLPNSDVSSGVATYEPIQSGGDEIALRRPNFFVHTQKKSPSEHFYTEFPLNEEVYASSSIGYSNVRVRSISYIGLEMMVPGYTDHQFFTADDYPIRMSNTDISKGRELRKPAVLGLIGISKRRFGLSYGTNIITNDMHGKFRAKKVYTQNGSLIYKMEHTYHKMDGELTNELPTIFSDGSLVDGEESRLIGQHSDFLTFVNKSESNYSSAALKMQAEIIPPAVTPSAYPNASTFENTIYTSLTSKITYQSGVIDSVIVEDNGRDKYTTNLLYDAKSGAAIVTEVIPEKGAGIRKMYDYTYPAYWKYEELGLDSDNARIERLNITGTDAVIEASQEVYFNVGDQLSVYEFQLTPIPKVLAFTGDFWVIENEATGDLFLVDKAGAFFEPIASIDYRFKVVDPGNKNSTGAAMANVSSLTGPSGSPYISGYPHQRVISISGIELFEDAKLGGTCVNHGTILNPYTHNIKGQWKLKHTYSFDGLRDYSTTNSRVDGCLTEYQPFWQNQDGTWMAIDDPARTGHTPSDPYQDWIQNGESTVHNEFGFGLESKNPLGIHSTAGVGYNHSYSTYNAVNARYQEIAFDGFEDYETNGILDGTGSFVEFPCQERHLKGETITISDLEAHTGKYSYLVSGPNDGIFITTVWDGIAAPSVTHISPFVLAPSEELDRFRLINDETDNRYVFSVWAKENGSTNPINYDAAGVVIIIDGSVETPSAINRSNIIDGWQRIEVIFEVDPTVPVGSVVNIQLLAANPLGVFYDDLRIHPFDSEMKSQVLDPVKQRISATLDSRNFATVYQYDENGTLIRIIQETERGMQTVKENRSGIVLNN